jgi:beta-galactosidase
MSEINDVTRRDFIRSTALTALAHAAPVETSAILFAQDPGTATVTAKEADMGSVFPAGAVYFRKSNPPAEDWARDHRTAAQVGMNTFRHWFMWSAIEVAPGKYDWADYDQMMSLAAQNGIKVIIAELVTAAPEWAFRKYAATRYRASDDTVVYSSNSGSSGTAGFPGLCLDNTDVKQLAERFLTVLIERYRNHPALLGYDLWNETTNNGGSPQKMYCYCEASKTKLREWLKVRYGTLEKVAKVWQRLSYETWDDVEPPRGFTGYAESLDWLQFRIDNAYSLFDWRIKLFRRLDPKHLVTCHGVAGTLESYPSSAHNEWMAASRVDVYGLTWVAGRKGTEPWKQFQALDLVRAGSRGKPFWHAEAQGGPLWMQPQVLKRPLEDGRISTPEDIRIWNMVSFAGGARGFLYTRFRPLLDGPLFGAFGPFGMDGSITPQAEMAGKTMRWANAHPQLWQSRPARGDVGLLFAPESELFTYVQQGSTDFYSQSMMGAYQAFFDSNTQADFVALENIEEYKVVYLAFPLMLKPETVARLKEFVTKGGMLICEGLPAYFGDHGHVGTVQPNYGLDETFGAREIYVEFAPDISDNLKLEVHGSNIYGRYFRQEYKLQGGKAVGHYTNGAIAAVEHQLGKGKTLLIGSFPGAAYYLHHGQETKALFADILKAAGVTPQVQIDDNAVQVRLHQGKGGTHLWVTNATATSRKVKILLDPALGSFATASDLWSQLQVTLDGRQLAITLPPKDAAVIALS